jgi:tetratricopeptide (TPR) repeat protein
MRSGLIALALVLAGRAHADPKAEAKDHVARGAIAFDAQHYDEALKELTLAYALAPDPQLLYAIGQVHVKLGDCEAAATFFRRFLSTKPDARDARVVSEAIAACKDHPPPHEAAPPPQPAPPPSPPPSPPPPPPQPVVVASPPAPAPAPVARAWYRDAIGDALVAAGIVAGGVAAFEYASARTSRDDADDARTYGAVQAKLDDASRDQKIAIGFAAGGGALVVAGILKLALSGGSDEHAIAVAPIHGGSVVSWARRF